MNPLLYILKQFLETGDFGQAIEDIETIRIRPGDITREDWERIGIEGGWSL